MGACFNYNHVPYCPPAELKEWFKRHVENLRYDKGHDGFNGTFSTCHGLNITQQKFKTEQEAYNFVSNNTDKRDAVMAVTVGDVSRVFPHTKADLALLGRLTTTRGEYENFEVDVLARAQAQKSAKKTCSHCGSSISLQHLLPVKEWKAAKVKNDVYALPGFTNWRGNLQQVFYRGPCDCPVCGKNLLITDTDKKRLARLGELLRELETKYREAKNAWDAKNPNQGYWFIGSWCAE